MGKAREVPRACMNLLQKRSLRVDRPSGLEDTRKLGDNLIGVEDVLEDRLCHDAVE